MPLILVDSLYYEKFVVAPLNAILYNVFNSQGGPELYGVEGPAYYLINLTLNFNLVLLASVASVPMLVSVFSVDLTRISHSITDLVHNIIRY